MIIAETKIGHASSAEDKAYGGRVIILVGFEDKQTIRDIYHNMPNLEFSIPYNNDPETLDEVLRLKKLGNNSIKEIFLSGPHEYSGAGRIVPRIKINEFKAVVNRIHRVGIRVNLIINPTCEGSGWYSPEVMRVKMEYLEQVHKEYGVEAVTIANPIYIKEVRRRFPDIEICASVLGDIDCVQRAIIYAKAGVNVITPDININRNLELLKEIKEATGTELKLLANEGCLYKCPFRKFHFNYISHISKELGQIQDVFWANCVQVTAKDPSQILKSGWIRPEDTKKYSEITSFFKLVDRNAVRRKAIRTVKAYLEESWDGDLLDILSGNAYMFGIAHIAYLDNKAIEKHKFFEKVTSCDKNCSQCGYCEQLAKELVSFGVISQGKLEDMGREYWKEKYGVC